MANAFERNGTAQKISIRLSGKTLKSILLEALKMTSTDKVIKILAAFACFVAAFPSTAGWRNDRSKS